LYVKRITFSGLGVGGYSLEAGYAARNAEFANGIGRLWSRRNLPAPLRD
jgi:23S rRNA (adenine2030-N6)-methyltransferase